MPIGLYLGGSVFNWENDVILYGPSAYEDLVQIILDEGYHKALIVTDEGIRENGLLTKLEDALNNHDISYAIYDQLEPNPV